MTELARLALRFADSQVGAKEEPVGSNRGPKVDEYLRWAARAGLIDPMVLTQGRKGTPWCAIFACWCIAQGARSIGEGYRPTLQYSAGCLRFVEKNEDLQLVRPEPGCLFVNLNLDGTGHCGFVVDVRDDGSLGTIEGNSDASGSRTGGSVVKLVRPADYPEAYVAIL